MGLKNCRVEKFEFKKSQYRCQIKELDKQNTKYIVIIFLKYNNWLWDHLKDLSTCIPYLQDL